MEKNYQNFENSPSCTPGGPTEFPEVALMRLVRETELQLPPPPSHRNWNSPVRGSPLSGSTYSGIVEELYDRIVLRDIRRPQAVGFKIDESRRTLWTNPASRSASASHRGGCT